MVDCWMSWSLDYALAFDREAADFNVRWIEEPLPPDDCDGFAELRRRVKRTQIATGEHEYTRWGLHELIDRGCADVLQPDVAWCGGVSEIRKVAAMASAYDLAGDPAQWRHAALGDAHDDDDPELSAGRAHRVRRHRRDAGRPLMLARAPARGGQGAAARRARRRHRLRSRGMGAADRSRPAGGAVTRPSA